MFKIKAWNKKRKKKQQYRLYQIGYNNTAGDLLSKTRTVEECELDISQAKNFGTYIYYYDIGCEDAIDAYKALEEK